MRKNIVFIDNYGKKPGRSVGNEQTFRGNHLLSFKIHLSFKI